MKKLLVLLSVLATLLVPSSALALDEAPVDPAIEDGSAAREFKQARAIWLEQGIRDYRMTVQRGCFCVGPFQTTITVRAGKPVKLSERPWYGPRTVPGMFKVVADAIKRRVPILDVTYNGRLGFPARVSIDYIALAVDDEISYAVKGVRKLRPLQSAGR